MSVVLEKNKRKGEEISDRVLVKQQRKEDEVSYFSLIPAELLVLMLEGASSRTDIKPALRLRLVCSLFRDIIDACIMKNICISRKIHTAVTNVSIPYFNAIKLKERFPPLRIIGTNIGIYHPHAVIRDVYYVKYLSEIELQNCMKLKDLSQFSHLQRVHLYGAKKLRDVSPLANVPEVLLQGCRRLKDLSPLKNVKKLSLLTSRSIYDVSCLGSVTELSLIGLNNIVRVTGLGGVHKLVISGCPHITKLSPLSTVYHLSLEQCFAKKVSKLAHVHTLDLFNMYYLKSLEGLTHVNTLSLTHCHQIRRLPRMEHTEKLVVSHCAKIDFILPDSQLHSIPTVYIENCPYAKHFTSFQTSSFLSVVRCNELQFDLLPLSSIKILIVDKCGVKNWLKMPHLHHLEDHGYTKEFALPFSKDACKKCGCNENVCFYSP